MTSKIVLAISLFILILLTWYTKTEIVTEREIVNFYSTQLSYEQIEQMLAGQKNGSGSVIYLFLYFTC